MTLGEMKTYVKQDLKRTDKDAEIVQAFNDMMVWISLQMPNTAYKFQSYINTTTEVEDYPLPVDIIHLIKPIRLLEGSNPTDSGYPLEELTKEEYDIREPNPNRNSPSKGKPSAFCIYSRSILLTPIPDNSTYLIEINWSKKPTSLSSNSESTYLGSQWDEVIKQGILERIYSGLGQMDEAMFWGSKYHAIVNGDDLPIGMCRKLFNADKDMEERSINFIRNNDL